MGRECVCVSVRVFVGMCVSGCMLTVLSMCDRRQKNCGIDEKKTVVGIFKIQE